MAKQYTVDQVITALQETKGMVYLAAERLGCHHQTIYNFIERHPTVKAARDAETGKMVDIGELKFFQAIQNGEPWAIAMLLKTKGKGRGYVERQEHTGADGKPLHKDTPDILILGGDKDAYIQALKAMAASNGSNGH